MMPAWTGPTAIWCRPSPSAGRNAIRLRFRRWPVLAKRMRDAPEAEVEPCPRVGRADCLQPEQIVDRAFEADRGRMAHGRRSDNCPALQRWLSTTNGPPSHPARPYALRRYRPTGRAACTDRPASASIACCQPSSATSARGQGRCPLVCLACVNLPSKAMALSQQPRDIVETSDQRRRQIDAGRNTSARCANIGR